MCLFSCSVWYLLSEAFISAGVLHSAGKQQSKRRLWKSASNRTKGDVWWMRIVGEVSDIKSAFNTDCCEGPLDKEHAIFCSWLNVWVARLNVNNDIMTRSAKLTKAVLKIPPLINPLPCFIHLIIQEKVAATPLYFDEERVYFDV